MIPDAFREDLAGVELGEVSAEQVMASRLTVWLGETLSAERRASAISLERRHLAIVAELDMQIRSQLGIAVLPQGLAIRPPVPSSSAPAGDCAQGVGGSERARCEQVRARCEQATSKHPAVSSNNAENGVVPDKDISKELRVPSSSDVSTVSNRSVVGLLGTIVENPRFDVFFMAAMLVNMVVMIAERQYEGAVLNDMIGFTAWRANGGREPGDTWHLADEDSNVMTARSVFFALDVVFGVCFVFEMLAKLAVMRGGYFKIWSNRFDVVINLLWFVDLFGVNIGIEPASLRMARLVRVTRLANIVMSMDRVGIFDSLRLLLVCLRSSVPIFVWSSLLLLFVVVVSGLLVAGIFSSILSDEGMPVQRRRELFQKFGSFSRSTLTMFELTFVNFMPVTDLLVRNLSEWWFVPVIMYKGIVGFGMLKVITGVFLKESFTAAEANDTLMVLHKERDMAMHTRKMSEFFAHGDAGGDGLVSWDDFNAILQNEWVKTWLSSMDLDVKDVRLVFELLDSEGDHSLTLQEMTKGFAHLKGAARSIDLQVLLRTSDRMEKQLSTLARTVADLQLAAARDGARSVAMSLAPFAEATEWGVAPTSSSALQALQPPPSIHRGDAFIGSCTEGVPDERLLSKDHL